MKSHGIEGPSPRPSPESGGEGDGRPHGRGSDSRMRRLSVRKKTAFATAVAVAFVAALELGARAVETARALRAGPSVESAVRARFHPLRYDLAPGSALPANGTVAGINSAGLRGAEPDRPKRRTRVL